MTPEQINLVQTTWAELAPQAPQAAELFYRRLFELDPSLRGLFKANMRVQGDKLMQMITLGVRGLDNPEKLLPALRELGHRHAAYGVRDADYDSVGAALLWTLSQGLGPAFTPEVARAWDGAYQLLAGAMQEGALAPATA